MVRPLKDNADRLRKPSSCSRVFPQHDEGETARIVVPEPATDGYCFSTKQFVDLIRAGQPIFRSSSSGPS